MDQMILALYLPILGSYTVGGYWRRLNYTAAFIYGIIGGLMLGLICGGFSLRVAINNYCFNADSDPEVALLVSVYSVVKWRHSATMRCPKIPPPWGVGYNHLFSGKCRYKYNYNNYNNI